MDLQPLLPSSPFRNDAGLPMDLQPLPPSSPFRNDAGLPMELMEQNCRIGPLALRNYVGPDWLHNLSVTTFLRDRMVTCHHVDAGQMRAMYGLLSDRISSMLSADAGNVRPAL